MDHQGHGSSGLGQRFVDHRDGVGPDDEIGGLLAQKLNAQGSFWGWLENIDINTLGFIIVGMFVATWVIALAIWRFGRIEERWDAHLTD